MDDIRMPRDALRIGRRRIEELDFCELIEDLKWNDSVGKWILHCRITIPMGSQFVSQKTEWFVLVDEDYPQGAIRFYPGKKNGIEVTFQHQNHNGLGNTESPWRSGNICCSTPMVFFQRRGYDMEPTNANERLLWNLRRARDWLDKASQNQLVITGEPFELPYFTKCGINQKKVIVFSEDAKSLHEWNQISESLGIAKLEEYEAVPKRTFVNAFLSSEEKELYRPSFGNAFSSKAKPGGECIWVKIRNFPIIAPWQAPANWGELKEIFKKENIDLKDLFSRFLKQFRDGRPHLLLIGFPIPKTFGGELEQMHWQPLYMPILSHGKKVKSFRPIEKGYLLRDFSMVFGENKSLNWHQSENWHAGQISTRGRYPTSVLKLSTVLIGAGALGSMFGELLVRSGLESLLILDDDELEIGNLVRHTLDITKIGYSKSEALAERLNLVNPNSRVSAYNTSFPTGDENINKVLEQCQLIIDCTANDFVISQLEQLHCESEKIFVSISTGVFAKRLFIYLAKGRKFDADRFQNSLKSWLDKENEEFDGYEFPVGGVGCWHPVFPARTDDLWLMASVASKVLVDTIELKIEYKQLMVFEQQIENNQFIGVKRVQ